jgi:hypothetical protein
MMLDGGPRGRRKPLAEHLTCPACLAHHVVAIDAGVRNGYRYRAAEKGLTASGGPATGTEREPTHQCRDCGFQWAAGAATAPTR